MKIVNAYKTIRNKKALDIPAAQAILEEKSMPCAREWMKDAHNCLLTGDLVNEVHNTSFTPGTLGYRYHAWLNERNLPINPISEKATRFEGIESEKVFVSNLGIVHDLLHVSEGYDTDTLGEAELAAWTWGNLNDKGLRYLLSIYAITHPLSIPRLIKAYIKGVRSPKATKVDWLTKVKV